MIAVAAPWLGTGDPLALSPIRRLRPPSAQYWFGTDMLGRDVYSRVMYGARVSLTVGLAVAVLSTLVGLAIGLVTGYLRWLDAVMMRVMDGLMSIPSVLLAIALISLTTASLRNVIVAITITEIPRVVRLVRSLVLTLREQPYVEAAIASGTRLPAILMAAAILTLNAMPAYAQAFNSTELKTGISNSLAVIMMFGFVLGISAVIYGGFAIRRDRMTRDVREFVNRTLDVVTPA